MKNLALIVILNLFFFEQTENGYQDDLSEQLIGTWKSVTPGNRDVWYFVPKDKVRQDCNYSHVLGALNQNWDGDYGRPWEYCVGKFALTGRDSHYEAIIERAYGRYSFKYRVQFFPGRISSIRISNEEFPENRDELYLDTFRKTSY